MHTKTGIPFDLKTTLTAKLYGRASDSESDVANGQNVV
jgi:hypothetical protein